MVGKRRISQFTEDLDRTYVLDAAMGEGYQAIAPINDVWISDNRSPYGISNSV